MCLGPFLSARRGTDMLNLSDDIKELRQQKGELANQADEILTKAKDEKRFDLSADENKKFDAIHADIEKLDAAITRMEKQEATRTSLEEPTGRRTSPNPVDNRPAYRGSQGRVTEQEQREALRAWMQGGDPEHQHTEDQHALAKRCGINLASKHMHIRMAPIPLKSTDPIEVRAWRKEVDEYRAALTGAQSTTTTGGYTVADAPMQALEMALLAYGGMRQVSTNIRTATGGPLPFPTTNDTSQKG